MTKTMQQILTRDAIHNPPYMSPRGAWTGGIALAWSLVSFVCFVAGWEALATFSAAVMATLFFVLGIDYSRAVMDWQGFQGKALRFEAKLSCNQCTEHGDLVVHLDLTNATPWAWNLRALYWRATDNLQIAPMDDEKTHELGAHRVVHWQFKAQAAQAGNAHVLGFGVLLESPLAFFRAEAHHATQLTLAIFPEPLRRRKRAPRPMLPQGASRARGGAMTREVNHLRTWMPSDPARSIAWRHYAKTQQMASYAFETRVCDATVCLLDAGPHMRLTRPDGASNLSKALALLAQKIEDSCAITLIVYDENGAAYVTKNAPFPTFQKKSAAWLMHALRWRPPSENHRDAAHLWNEAAFLLHEDYRLYEQVDFSSIHKNEQRIRLNDLVQWARTDLALKAFESKKPEQAHAILHMPYASLLTYLIQHRTPMPQPPREPHPPSPKLLSGSRLLVQALKSSPTRVLWLSDFGLPVSPLALKKIASCFKKHRIQPEIVEMPMPFFARNFVPALAETYRDQVRFALAHASRETCQASFTSQNASPP